MLQFVFQYFAKRNLGFLLNFDLWHSWKLEGLTADADLVSV